MSDIKKRKIKDQYLMWYAVLRQFFFLLHYQSFQNRDSNKNSLKF